MSRYLRNLRASSLEQVDIHRRAHLHIIVVAGYGNSLPKSRIIKSANIGIPCIAKRNIVPVCCSVFGILAGNMNALTAACLTKIGIACDADNVLITSGSQQALDYLGKLFLSPGDTALVGWTPLGHFELQRKRARPTLKEVLK